MLQTVQSDRVASQQKKLQTLVGGRGIIDSQDKLPGLVLAVLENFPGGLYFEEIQENATEMGCHEGEVYTHSNKRRVP